MSNPVLKKNQLIDITITGYAFGGTGIGKIPTEDGDFAVFVQNVIPGQRVRAQVEKCRKRHAECRLVEILEPSPDEVPVPYQAVSGAPFATLPIEKQIGYKKQSTIELFRRIGKIENAEILFDHFIESPSAWHYRNKMEYSFSAIRHDLATNADADDFALGFKHRGTWWKVENLDKDSGLFDASFETELAGIRTYLEKTGLEAWHPPRKTGFFRYLVVRKSFATDSLLVNLVTTDEGLEHFDRDSFTRKMQSLFGERLAGLIHTINTDRGERVEPLHGNTVLLCGDSKITEQLNGLDFEISMKSFFQTNPRCAEKLYSQVIQYVEEVWDKEQPGECILDLFCGTGTITQLLARGTGQRVIGVDVVEPAIADARVNAVRNNVDSCEFVVADAGKFLTDFPELTGRISVIVLDPPRAGIAPKTLQKIIALGARNMVYVSCNPATLARDTESLALAGYELKKFCLADQFPHTAHVECIALFTHKNAR